MPQAFYFTRTIFTFAFYTHSKRNAAKTQYSTATIFKIASLMINNDATFQTGLSDSTQLEHLKHDIMAMFCHVYYNAAYFRLVVCAIMWAGVQQKILLQLTPFTRECTRVKYRHDVFNLTNFHSFI
ncbi:uncharacterized protein TrAtP1_009990 [Trichoderma atroviride]|uniref:uncharacterized protein n=1 Tax=Hypocrea atroviridis TaxID=63577 RepID=UPI003327BC03|nr:hypothetical protein TrAtP1_009990 [Trichoderma atroviride]